MTPDERRAYNRAYRLANKEKLAAYAAANAEKIKARSKARYERNRDKIIARTRAWQAKNYDTVLQRTWASNKRVQALNKLRAVTVKRMFELLPLEAREEYAQWLLFLGDVDGTYGTLVRIPSLDYGYIARYAAI
ncbi:hypothetical protein [Devosia sp.]|uniref:hypothetical protein n=1 Tax=Devosia sp. TaxID=1871048 RepID=UPI001B1559E9|nr:hypothetical protein [Devosia sp.]MBO9589448.1 hypothetical protein [Devosia sp.]